MPSARVPFYTEGNVASHHCAHHPFPSPSPHSRTAQTQETMPKTETDNTGTFIPDSGAYPTPLVIPTSNMTSFKHPTLTTTATRQQRKCTHHGSIEIQPHNNSTTLCSCSVANRLLKNNLLSVQDSAKHYGPVSFTANRGTIYNMRFHPRQVLRVAEWCNQQYKLKGTLVSFKKAKNSRSISYKPRDPAPRSKTIKNFFQSKHNTDSTTAGSNSHTKLTPIHRFSSQADHFTCSIYYTKYLKAGQEMQHAN